MDSIYSQIVPEDVLLEIRISEYLMRKARYVATEEIRKEFNLSGFYTRKIIRTLEQDIKEYNNSGFAIDVSLRGVKLEVPIGRDLKSFFIYILEPAPRLKIIEYVLHNKFKTIAHYALENHISEATARRHLREVRSILKPISIGIASKTFEFTGEEGQIRMFLLVFYWKINRGLYWPFTTVSEKKVEMIVNNFKKHSFFKKLSLLEKKRVMFLFAICQLRINSGNRMNYEHIPETSQNYANLKRVIKAANIMSEIKEEEVYFAYLVFKGLGLFANMEEEIAFEVAHSQPAGLATNYAINKMRILPLDDKAAVALFSSHSFANILNHFLCDLDGEDYSLAFTNYFPNLKAQLERFFDLAYKETQLALFKEKSFLTIQYTMLLADLPQRLALERKITIYLETTLPQSAENLIAKQIKIYFQTKYHLIFVSPADVFKKMEIDIVLTTIPLSDYQQIYSNAEIIAINKELHASDYEKIEKVLQSFLKR